MYNHFFGFSESPFNVTPDPKFLFFTESHREAHAAMRYAIQERKGFVVITGEVGTGKTTLIFSLLKGLDDKVKIVFIHHTSISFEQLLKEILRELDLPVTSQDKTALLLELNNYLIERLARDENLAIIIDEAQNLNRETLEELRMLSNLETPSSKLLQILFVGQPEFEEIINAEDLRQLKQRIWIRIQIKPLTPEECRQYIEHRLALVGSSSSRVFTPEAMSLICELSNGIPRIINILCDNALLIAYGLSKKNIEVPIIQEVLKDMGLWPKEKTDKKNVEPDEKPPKARPKRKNIVAKVAYVVALVIIGLGVLVYFGRDHIGKYVKGNMLWEYIEKVIARTSSSSIGISSPAKEPAAKMKPEVNRNALPTIQAQKEPSTAEPPGNALERPVTPASSKAETRSIRAVRVEKGKTIFALCQEYYNLTNTTLADLILESNPEITDVHRIMADGKIRIPEITESSLIAASGEGSYGIYLGTFISAEFANAYKNVPSLRGKEIKLVPKRVSAQETWYRIRAEKFASREESLEVIQTLKKKGLLPAFGGKFGSS
jgi:general secretion pathway protein A